MRGPFLIAVLCVLVQVLTLTASDAARAEATPDASENASAKKGLPWESQSAAASATKETPSKPDSAVAPEPQSSESDVSPATQEAASEPAADQGPVPAHPVVAVIREKLADPAVTKGADAEDIAALQAFYRAWGQGPVWITEMGFSAKGHAALFEIEKADDWGLEADAFALPDAHALPANDAAQALAEIKLDLAILKYARFARGGRHVPSEISELFDQTPPLGDAKTVMVEIAAAKAPESYLQSLHPQHEQFARLRKALLEARDAEEPKETDIRRFVINMERWRWLPEDLGAVYVWLNTPEFMLYVVKDGETIFRDKTLVGTIDYPTPVFSADMKTIVFNPDWVAPPSVLEDKLWPALKRKYYNILKSNKLKVSYKGKPVDPKKIDWQRVNIHNFTFTQRSGPKNVLGKAKFLYPNKHIVYMHDTLPYRQKIFKEDKRAIGYGCVRMEKPRRLAEILLAEDDEWPASEVKDKVKALWENGVDSDVTIDATIPVHTTYFTAVVDDEGKVATFDDLYGLDRKHAVALFDSTEGFPQPPPEPKPRSHSVASSGTPPRGSGGGFASSMGFVDN